MNSADWICYLECDGLTIDEISAWYVHVWFEGQFQLMNPWKYLPADNVLRGLR